MKILVCTFASLFLIGCVSQNQINHLQAQIDELERHRQGMGHRIEQESERVNDLERYKKCHNATNGPDESCRGQWHWGGSEYWRIEQLECRMSALDGQPLPEWCNN